MTRGRRAEATRGRQAEATRGRQAEARRNDTSVLDAARLVFAVHGPDAPMSAVAAQAGVGMGSLYRRFASKEAMLAHLCEASLAEQVEAAEAAVGHAAGTHDAAAAGELVAAAAWQALAGFVSRCVTLRVGVFASLAGTIPVSPAMVRDAHRTHGLLEVLVSRAREAGALRPDVSPADLHLLVELFSRRPAGEEDAFLRVLGVALDGLRAPARSALPGQPRGWDSLAKRWMSRTP